MSSFLPNNDPGVNVVVTKEEFNLFHSIDRLLFYRFVVGLGADPNQTTYIMAFIIWLEKFTRDFKMVSNLLQWPNSLLADLADEAILALTCIDNNQFPYPASTSDKLLLPLIQKITRSSVNLMYFHEKRFDIIPSITRILNNVCIRAFSDIIQQLHYNRVFEEQQRPSPTHTPAPAPAPAAPFYGPMPHPPNSFVQPMFYYSPMVPDNVPYMPQPPMMVSNPQWHEGNSSSSRVPFGVDASGGSGNMFGPYLINKDEFNQEFNEILNSFNISDDAERMDMLAPDARTIFMTFSKGYPISENEVREFFSRIYGDVIESIYMQEVTSEHEQPLYARLVLRPGAIHMLDGLLDGTSTIKFIINGKHVWARRFFRKENKSPTHEYSPFGLPNPYH